MLCVCVGDVMDVVFSVCRNSNSGGLKGMLRAGAPHLSAPNPKIYMLLTLFLIRDRAPF